MSQKIEIDGQQIEVYTADELQQATIAAVTAKETEFGKTKEELEKNLTDARTALGMRTKEFGEFRKLNDEQKSKLTETERALYENQELLQTERERNVVADKAAYESTVVAAIRSRIGVAADQAAFDKVRGMYDLVNLEDVTPEQIAVRVSAALGALGQTSPDLLATIGMSGGNFQPPQNNESDKSFADSEQGKALGNALGLTLEAPKKK